MISLANLFFVLLTYLIESWISPCCSCEFYQSCATRQINIYYTTTTYEVHTFKEKIWNKMIKTFLFIIFSFYFLFLSLHFLFLLMCSCIFVIIETCAYNIAHEEDAMSSLVIHSSGQKQPPVLYSKSCS